MWLSEKNMFATFIYGKNQFGVRIAAPNDPPTNEI